MIFTSPLCTDSAQPVPVSDISTLAFKLGRENGFGDDTDALLNIDGPTGKAMSYAEVYEMASQIASGLQNKLRLTKGDVVTTYLLCDIHSHAIIHGTLMAGCSIMMEGPVYPVEEFASRLEQAKPKAIFTHPVHLGQVWAALRMPGVVAAASGGWPKIILTQDIDTGSGQQTNAPEDIEVQTIAELLSTAPYERLSINTWEEMDNTIALIGYSSGTTGKPKGILVPHRTLVSCLHQELTSKVMPLGKSYPCGDDDKGRRFPVDMVTFPPMMRIAQLVERYRIEAMYTTPTVPEEIVARWEDARLARYDWSSFKDLHSAGAPTSEIVVEQFVGQLGARISSPYGSSECLGISFTFADSPQGSVGKLLPGIFAKVVDIQTGKGKSYSVNTSSSTIVKAARWLVVSAA
ncbi:hypothetical protein EV182_002958 [Spiromyces aspiralis]|uniref:Uncharacterized protein n=1 Tax=Spiromyces aspiralis TaxID=68401 RepID=A0ACC1HUS3_9FUNG|nr:hypothetical protein EV182_002958 [Spiromyces aspiralis]